MTKLKWIFLIFTALLSVTSAFADTYTVQSGDTLSTIAKHELGQAAHWKQIAELNNLKEPYALNVGQQLKMPSSYSNTNTIRQSSPIYENEPQQVIIGESSVEIDSFGNEKNKTFNIEELLPWLFIMQGLTVVNILVLLAYVVFWIFMLGIGYRFSASALNIEATFSKCIHAALLVCLSLFIIGGVAIWAGYSFFIMSKLSQPVFVLTIILSISAIVFLSALIVRSRLNCRWGVAFVIGFLGFFVDPAVFQAILSVIILIVWVISLAIFAFI